MSSIRLPALPSLREVLRIHGLRAQKQLSQNFLLQPGCLNKIAKTSGSLRNKYVLEVGPGPGCLTRSILRLGPPKHLAVVELDRRFLPCLEELRISGHRMGCRFDIYHGDVLKFPTDNLFPNDAIKSWDSDVSDNFYDSSVKVIGNLPFNISTPLISKWLHDISEKRGIWSFGRVPLTLTFQKEVADRLCANSWSDDRSRLSVMAQLYCTVLKKGEISGSAFLPPAKVDTGIVKLLPKAVPLVTVPFPYVEKFVKFAFQFRQKKIVRCLEPLFPPQQSDLLVRLFREASVIPTKYPVQLDLLEFRDLINAYVDICKDNQGLFEYEFRSAKNCANWNKRKIIQEEVYGERFSVQNIVDNSLRTA